MRGSFLTGVLALVVDPHFPDIDFFTRVLSVARMVLSRLPDEEFV